MILMAATSFVALAIPNSAALSDLTDESALGGDGSKAYGAKPMMSVSPEKKLDSRLADAVMKSDGPFKVQVFISDRDAANEYLAAHDLPLVKGAELPGLPTSRILELSAVDIMGLASNPGVLKVLQYERPQIDERSAVMDAVGEDWEVAPPEVEDLDVDYLHGAWDAWMEGYTGAGVNIAVIDTGFDMAHPDLQGQQARYTFGPYAGWPIAYDDQAAWMWANWEIGGWVADTRAVSPDLGGFVEFDGYWWDIWNLQDVWGNPVTSQSGFYHVGWHTDQNLQAIWGTPIGVLVVDANIPGFYDTVYVDIYPDFSFSDEKACTMGDEISYSDFNDPATGWNYGWNSGDGYADLSGGMVYWISDGMNVYPFSDYWYGAGYVPGSGDAVAFVGEFSYGQSHGTMTSSAALAYPNSMGGMLAGMAPEAKLICIPFTGDI
ncbi:MAG: S8 family serine peptidase, partial [Candidatus Thermoplasmatota archaeon]|nr:S8 family serine peptidase [Candidatus Thermoplasmatota archaeon]